MKKRFFLLLTMLTLSFGGFKYIVNACSCLILANNFCETMHYTALIEELNNTNNTLVALGVKVDTVSYAMRFKIIDILHGEEEKDTITVWGDTTGIYCDIDVRGFAINDTLVLSIYRLNGNSFPKVIGDYVLSACDIQYLFFKNRKVQGYIYDGYSNMEYSVFKDLFTTCYQPVGVQELKALNGFEVQLYPNPVADMLHINLLNGAFAGTPITYSIINTVGAVVFSSTTSATQQSVPTAQLPAGVYFAVLQTATQKITQKIIIQ